MQPEHTLAMFRSFAHAQLAILPATDHAQIMERADLLLPLIAPFLAAP